MRSGSRSRPSTRSFLPQQIPSFCNNCPPAMFGECSHELGSSMRMRIPAIVSAMVLSACITWERIALYLQRHLRDDPIHPRRNLTLFHRIGMREVIEVLPDFQVLVHRQKIGKISNRSLRRSGSRATSTPSMTAFPVVGVSSPQAMRMVVVLPA